MIPTVTREHILLMGYIKFFEKNFPTQNGKASKLKVAEYIENNVSEMMQILGSDYVRVVINLEYLYDDHD